MKTRYEKLRQPGSETMELRNKELIVTPTGQAVPTEALGINSPHPNGSRVNLPAGTAVISPVLAERAKTIARRQSSEVKKLNETLKDIKATPLAKRTAERRLAALRHQYDPIIMAEQAARGGDVNTGGVRQAAFGAIAATAAQVLPALYNIGQGIFGNEEQLDPNDFNNPYEGNIRSLMANRRFNVNPLLESNQAATAAANYNLRNAGLGGGAYAANRIGLQNSRMRADAQAYATKQQADNQYMGEEANVLASLGNKRADTKLMISDLNARNRAAKNNYLAAGLGQLGQFAQVQQQAGGMKARDAQLMGLYKDWMGMFAPKGVPSSTPAVSPQLPAFNYTPDPSYAWQMQGRDLNNY